MKRIGSMEEISDGKLYGLNDMVKAECGNCKGCSACCHEMGDSVVLDPFDIAHLCKGLNLNFSQLSAYIDFHVEDGVILPHLKTAGADFTCVFLNGEGRCQVHAYRPGICRLFPLGRYYQEDTFQYFLQIHECVNKNRTKIKVKKWLDTPELAKYEAYIWDWHTYLKRCKTELKTMSAEEQKLKNMELLNRFYMTPYKDEDFYAEFYYRLQKI